MDSHREMRVDMSLLVSTELRHIKRESPVWMATLNPHAASRATMNERGRRGDLLIARRRSESAPTRHVYSNIDMSLKSRAGKSRSRARKKQKPTKPYMGRKRDARFFK